MESGSVESGMKRFHRVLSLTLLCLGSLILAVEFFRTEGANARGGLVGILLLAAIGWRLMPQIRTVTGHVGLR